MLSKDFQAAELHKKKTFAECLSENAHFKNFTFSFKH